MTDILILPPELREISRQLQTSAQMITSALRAMDGDLLALKGDEFLGHSADVFQARYAQHRLSLLKAQEIVTHFANNLKATADVFEQADGGNLSLASLSPAAPGSVLGTSTQATDTQRYLDLLQQEKAQRALIEAWMKKHPEMDGWTLAEVNKAMASIRRLIANLESGIVDMQNPKDIGHWLMNVFTDADDKFIESSNLNIQQLQGLLQKYDERIVLLNERAAMESELAAIQQQKTAVLQPYLSITDSASRQDWVNQLPPQMQKEFMSGPRTITNAPLQIPANELDRDSYTAILNQFVSSKENPRYARDDYGTYCDVYVRDVLRSTGVTIYEYGSINRIAQDLGNNPQWEVVTAEEAQLRANAGIPAVVLMDSDHTYQAGNIHGAMVAPSDQPFDASQGPQIAQAGRECCMVADNKYVSDYFSQKFADHVVYYALIKQ